MIRNHWKLALIFVGSFSVAVLVLPRVLNQSKEPRQLQEFLADGPLSGRAVSLGVKKVRRSTRHQGDAVYFIVEPHNGPRGKYSSATTPEQWVREGRLQVRYRGRMPRFFSSEADMLIEGSLDPETQIFDATSLLTLCPDTYIPKYPDPEAKTEAQAEQERLERARKRAESPAPVPGALPTLAPSPQVGAVGATPSPSPTVSPVAAKERKEGNSRQPRSRSLPAHAKSGSKSKAPSSKTGTE